VHIIIKQMYFLKKQVSKSVVYILVTCRGVSASQAPLGTCPDQRTATKVIKNINFELKPIHGENLFKNIFLKKLMENILRN